MPPRARIWNPATRRYVLKSGKVGKTLQARQASPISESDESNGETTCESEAMTTEGSSDEASCTESSFVDDDDTTSDENDASSTSEDKSTDVDPARHVPKRGGRGASTKKGRGTSNINHARKRQTKPKRRVDTSAQEEDNVSHETKLDAPDSILLPFPRVDDEATDVVDDAHEIELAGKLLSASQRKTKCEKKRRK